MLPFNFQIVRISIVVERNTLDCFQLSSDEENGLYLFCGFVYLLLSGLRGIGHLINNGYLFLIVKV